jgi:hypothetical protein
MEEMRNAHKSLVGKLKRKTPLGRPRHIWKDNVTMDLKKIGYEVMNLIYLAWARAQW